MLTYMVRSSAVEQVRQMVGTGPISHPMIDQNIADRIQDGDMVLVPPIRPNSIDSVDLHQDTVRKYASLGWVMVSIPETQEEYDTLQLLSSM